MKLFWAFSSFEVGGAQRRFASLALALGTGFDHVVAAMDGRFEAEALLADAVSYRRREIPAIRKSAFLSGANIDAFAAVLAEEKPDLLLTTNWGSIEWRPANRRAKIPHLHFEDGFGPDEALGGRNWKRDFARKILFSKAASGHDRFAFAAPSSGLAEIFTRDWGVPRARVHYIANGVDIDRFAEAPPHKDNAVPVIGSVGALRAEKRFDRLLRVFAELRKEKNARLLLVGDGPSRGALEELARDLNIHAHTTFAGAQSDVAPLLAQMDVYAITSDTEQMPISLIEAMAAGKAVVGSDVGDVARMIAPENLDHIHARENEKAMTRSLAALIDDASARTRLGAANAAKAAAEFSVETMTERYRALFETL